MRFLRLNDILTALASIKFGILQPYYYDWAWFPSEGKSRREERSLESSAHFRWAAIRDNWESQFGEDTLQRVLHEKTQERVNRTGNPGTWVLPPHTIQTQDYKSKQGSRSAFPVVTFTSTLARDSVNCSSLMRKMFCQLLLADENLRAKAEMRGSPDGPPYFPSAHNPCR